MHELTRRQREILGFIKTFTQRHSVPPTVREIGARFHFTPRAAFDHLRALERKGHLRRRVTAGRSSRNLTLVERAPATREVPVYGRIAAGEPLFAEQNLEGTLPVGVEWLASKGEEVFALKVHGDSMINAHIVEGDLVLVRRQQSAELGDIVVALLDNEATVKRFARQGEAIVLKPEHPTMAPILVRQGQKDFKILGKVVGLVRGF
ncbi:MAG: SOS-response transcriptional repressor, LexA, repressor LexA [Candidatus Rokubacteria bacterium CSP1-6]|nr:MAG: SOS-response transcriptional repressor, LexA, repressor LexA [Candidatus Rokubacteria bacterium CSP1-6]